MVNSETFEGILDRICKEEADIKKYEQERQLETDGDMRIADKRLIAATHGLLAVLYTMLYQHPDRWDLTAILEKNINEHTARLRGIEQERKTATKAEILSLDALISATKTTLRVIAKRKCAELPIQPQPRNSEWGSRVWDHLSNFVRQSFATSPTARPSGSSSSNKSATSEMDIELLPTKAAKTGDSTRI